MQVAIAEPSLAPIGAMDWVKFITSRLCRQLVTKKYHKPNDNNMCKVYHRVVLVDDEAIQNKINKMLIQHYLGKHYIEIISFTDPVQAIMFLQNETAGKLHTLIFLDLNMPTLSGWDFLDHLNYVNMSITTLYIVSSSIREDDIERAYNHPRVSGYLLKPLNPAINGLFADTLAALVHSSNRNP